MSADSVDFRLAPIAAAQYVQTGVRNSTDSGAYVNLSVTGTATIVNSTITNLAVSSSFTVQSSALKSMAFQSSTNINVTGGLLAGVTSTSELISGSSINSTPIGLTTPSTGKFTELYSSSTAALASVQSTAVNLTGGTIDGTKVGLTTPSSGKFTDLTVTGTISFGTFTPDVVAAILGYVTIQTSTGGTVRLAAVST